MCWEGDVTQQSQQQQQQQQHLQQQHLQQQQEQQLHQQQRDTSMVDVPRIDLSKIYRVDAALSGINHVPGAKKVVFWQNRLESCKSQILLMQVHNCMKTFLDRDKEVDMTYEMAFKVAAKHDSNKRKKIIVKNGVGN